MRRPQCAAERPIRPEVLGGNTSDVATPPVIKEGTTTRDALVPKKMPRFVRTRLAGTRGAFVMTDNCTDSDIKSLLPMVGEGPPSLPIVAR